MKFVLVSLASALCIAGCASSPPLHYYTLVPSSVTAPGAAPAAFAIDVLPVGVPEQQDQQRLVIRQGSGGLAVLENERWGSPLSGELRSALSLELSRRLGAQDVGGLTPPPGRPVFRIKVQVRRFDAWPGDRTQLDADWSVAPSSDASGARSLCHSALEEATPGSHADMIQGQQRLVARLAEQIGAALQRPDRTCAVG